MDGALAKTSLVGLWQEACRSDREMAKIREMARYQASKQMSDQFAREFENLTMKQEGLFSGPYPPPQQVPSTGEILGRMMQAPPKEEHIMVPVSRIDDLEARIADLEARLWDVG